MLFKENASKLLNISRMTKDEYVQKEEEPEKILNEEIPKAMQIFSGSLSDGYFCDVGSTPLSFLARQVADILVVEHLCTDPAAVGAAILADLSLNKENEQQIRSQLGVSTLKVWKEVKLFLDPRACETEAHKLDNVCVDAECKMSWLRDKHFSVSAKLAMAAWICLLGRLVTEVSGLSCPPQLNITIIFSSSLTGQLAGLSSMSGNTSSSSSNYPTSFWRMIKLNLGRNLFLERYLRTFIRQSEAFRKPEILLLPVVVVFYNVFSAVGSPVCCCLPSQEFSSYKSKQWNRRKIKIIKRSETPPGYFGFVKLLILQYFFRSDSQWSNTARYLLCGVPANSSQYFQL